MKPISQMKIVEIDVTNCCHHNCSNCVRFCGHYRPERRFYLSPEEYQLAVESYVGHPGMVGMIGGEPTIHPQFEELCKILQKTLPKEKRMLFCNPVSPGYLRHKDLIKETFGDVFLNDHTGIQAHAPVLVSSVEVGVSEGELWKLANNCWVQQCWSATVTPKGAYFCEVAGTLAYLFDGPDGWVVEPGWWRREPEEYQEQANWACRRCGLCLPLRPRRPEDGVDDVCPSSEARLREIGSPKLLRGEVVPYEGGLVEGQTKSKDWFLFGSKYL